MIFSFNKNDFFTNETLTKEYKINDEHLVEQIVSTEINWTKKEFLYKKVDKKMKNKSKYNSK